MMSWNGITAYRGLVAAVLILLGPGLVDAKEQAKIKAAFQNTGVEAAATGFLKAKLRDEKSTMKVILRGLQGGVTYSLVVGSIPEATGTTSPSGKLGLRFRQPVKSIRDNPLDFDPRGQSITVSDGISDVLEVVFSGTGEPADIRIDDRTELAPTALAPGAKAEARFRLRSGRSRFKVQVEDVADGSYDLFVGGTLRGTVSVAGGRGEIEFDSQPQPGKVLLDFDPRGLVVDVTQGTDVFFSGAMVAQAGGVNTCEFQESEHFLTSTGADPDAKAKARFRIRDDCDQDFRVEVEDVPLGDYTLSVGGVARGTITVVDTGSEIEGQIEFDTDPDEAGEQLLDFDPRGQVVEITQGVTTFFSDTFEAGGPGGSTCAPEETQQQLASTGADPDADADARFRVRDDCDQDFRVEIQDVPVGDYTLLVAGTDRGTISVVDTGAGIEGQIEFDTDPDDPGEFLLDFDPRGALVEIAQGGTTFFSDVFGTGGGGGPAVCEPTETEVPFLNTGPVSQAKGDARFRERDDCDQDFRVEIEDLPEGDYDLVVDGTTRGTITVAFNPEKNENDGQIEFDTDPDEPGELLLDFDPRGQLLEVEQAGTLFLERTFPGA